MSSSESEDDDPLSHFKPSGLLYSNPEISNSIKAAPSRPPSDSRSNSSVTSKLPVLKYYECEDSCDPSKMPTSSTFKVFVFKGSEVIETIELSQRSYYRLGRDESINHIHLLHESCSSQHAVLQYRRGGAVGCRLYLMDLGSANGSGINSGEILLEGMRFYEILDGDVVKFGGSTRDYVFMRNK